jgi:hypothetical protein
LCGALGLVFPPARLGRYQVTPVARHSEQMCKDFQRLKQEYERTLRVWAYDAFPLPGDVLEFPGRFSQLKYEATVARNKAAGLLSAHRETCPLCRNNKRKLLLLTLLLPFKRCFPKSSSFQRSPLRTEQPPCPHQRSQLQEFLRHAALVPLHLGLAHSHSRVHRFTVTDLDVVVFAVSA